MREIPLHVQVAKALGWTYLGPAETDPHMDDVPMWEGEPPQGHPWNSFARRIDQHVGIPRYDTDWSATGPLIEKYGIWLIPDGHSRRWTAWIDPEGSWKGEGSTAPIAVCNLILALKEAGKLVP